MPPSGRAGFAGSAVCAAGRGRPSTRWTRERRLVGPRRGLSRERAPPRGRRPRPRRGSRRGSSPNPRAPRRGHRRRDRAHAAHRPAGAEVAVLMAIVVDNDTRLVVQGLTGREGSFHALRNRRYGTHVVAGVTPGKGGQEVEGIPVFDTVADAVAETDANTTMVFVPARFAT